MRRALTALLAAAALASPAFPAEGTRYGAGLTGTEVVKISELRANPDRYVGKTVRVEGLVTDVCPRRGCWMELASDREFETMRIKVDDGVIVFPLTAKGKVATAEGVFTRIVVPADRVLAMKRHEAEEKGVAFDEKAVKVEPMIVYQVQGTGAVVR
jgi:cytochrome c-type biogenesis protein CcmE